MQRRRGDAGNGATPTVKPAAGRDGQQLRDDGRPAQQPASSGDDDDGGGGAVLME
ncbi:hypothetical protein Scep_016289 [Stephania cephalantha]|uniref:Uncharacterized protein n=1 Tax=Stephania cephalantha TaxID=152367 RepID=A0AAP0NVN0_9MAGN